MKPQFLLASRRQRPFPTTRSGATLLRTGSPPRTIRSLPRRSPTAMWSYFFGKGIIDPVDDIRASNPPVESRAAGRAHEGFRRPQFRSARPDAHHRQLAHLSGVHRDQRVERQRPRQLLPCDSAAPCRGRADGCGFARRQAPGRDSPKFRRTRVLRSWWTRTSAKRGFWMCSDVRRGIRPASASGAPISASRKRSIW